MQQWEYTTIESNKKSIESEIDSLNELGDEGWELVSVMPITITKYSMTKGSNSHTGGFVLVLKRPKV